jgi:hypothetical protein
VSAAEVRALEGAREESEDGARSRWPRRQVGAVVGVVLALAAGSLLAASPAPAAPATCQYIGDVLFGNIEPPLAVDATCIDPDYNENTFVFDSTQQLVYTDSGGRAIPYTEVKGHFPATNTRATLPAGVYSSATLNRHDIVWRFPSKDFWRNRSFQQTYPLQGTAPLDLNEVDLGFAFTNGAFTVKVNPGNPNTGYRVNAAATKLAKAYANQLYGNSAPIYSYLWGQSGGSVQALGAAEGTTGVWAGVIPAVIATDGLNVHSFQWGAHYALAVPPDKRAAVRQAAEVGSGRSIYDGLDAEQRSVLDELLQAGYPRQALGEALSLELPTGDEIPVGDATVGTFVGPFPGVAGPSILIATGTGEIRRLDPTYEDDFWSKSGYEGTNPPSYLTAAKVDGFATITDIVRDAQGVPTALKFDPATVPALGSIGATNLEYYVYAADGTSRTIDDTDPAKPIYTLTGTLDTTTSTLMLAANTSVPPKTANSPVLLNALSVGGKIRINNRFFLAAVYYPRHSILDNGNPAYNQYKDLNGKPRYVQRDVQTAYLSNLRASGGVYQTGDIKTKMMVMENLEDGYSFPYVAGFYSQQVQKALGRSKFDDMFRVYYQEHAGHSNGGFVQGIFNQMVLDLVAWAEQGTPPKPSSRFTIDPTTQIVQPLEAVDRKGLQPVVNLTANGGDRAEVGILQPVNLSATITMPPDTGKIFQYNWSILPANLFSYGTSLNQPGAVAINEPATVLSAPQDQVVVNRTMTFETPGEYLVSLTANGDRNGTAGTPTEVKNLDRIRVVVH